MAFRAPQAVCLAGRPTGADRGKVFLPVQIHLAAPAGPALQFPDTSGALALDAGVVGACAGGAPVHSDAHGGPVPLPVAPQPVPDTERGRLTRLTHPLDQGSVSLPSEARSLLTGLARSCLWNRCAFREVHGGTELSTPMVLVCELTVGAKQLVKSRPDTVPRAQAEDHGCSPGQCSLSQLQTR